MYKAIFDGHDASDVTTYLIEPLSQDRSCGRGDDDLREWRALDHALLSVITAAAAAAAAAAILSTTYTHTSITTTISVHKTGACIHLIT